MIEPMTFNSGDRVVIVDYPANEPRRLSIIGRVGTVRFRGVSFWRVRLDNNETRATMFADHELRPAHTDYGHGVTLTYEPGDPRYPWALRDGSDLYPMRCRDYEFAHNHAQLCVAQQISSATADEQHTPPTGGESETVMYGITEGNLITDGSTTAVVKATTAAFIIAAPQNGGDEFVLNASAASNWSVLPTALVVERPFVVYDANGQRVDGYKFESRARRNNDARFAGQGYWIGKVDPDSFTWVPA